MTCRSGWALNLFTLVVLMGTVLSAPTAGTAESRAQAAIRTLLDAQARAWNAGEIEGFMAGYWKSDQTEFAGAGGMLRGWQAVLDRYRRTYPDRKAMGQLTFSDLEITVLSRDAAYIVGRWQLEREGDRPGGIFTLIVRKFPEGWRIVHDHTSAFASATRGGAKLSPPAPFSARERATYLPLGGLTGQVARASLRLATGPLQ
jgi:ketosteroid isomerase-like protein